MRLVLFIFLQCLCAFVSSRSKTSRERVCDVEFTREFRQSRDKFELVTTLSMDHEHFKACIMDAPTIPFMQRLVCNVHVRENFPSNLAIDPLELKFLESKYNYRAFMPTPVDPSETTNTSSPFQLDLFVADVWPNPDWVGYPSSIDLVSHMPIHPRVHSPPPPLGVSEVEFELPPPSRVGIRCEPPRMTQVWNPIEARKNHVQKPPHGLNFRSSVGKGREGGTMSYASLDAMVTQARFVELKVVETESYKFKISVDSLPKFHILRSVVGLKDNGMPIGVTAGVGGTAVLLMALALYKVIFSSDSKQPRLANTGSAAGKSKNSSTRGSHSGTSRKKAEKAE